MRAATRAGAPGADVAAGLTTDPTLENRLLPTLEERARGGLTFLTVASAVLVVFDLRNGGANAPAMVALEILRVVTFGSLVAYFGRPRGELRARLFGLLGIAVLASTSAIMGSLRGEFLPHLVVTVGIALGCAAGVPWGVWPQATATVMLSLGLIVNLALLPDHGAGLASPSGVFAYLMTMGASIYVAILDAARRRAAQQALAEARRAEAALHRVNEMLERNVQERTADLGRANRDLTFANRDLAASNRDLEQAYRELEGFTHTVSHDLRVPLRVIHGLSHLTLEQCGEVLGEDGRSYLARIGEAAVRLGDIGDDLLTLARVTRATMLEEDVDLSEVARMVVAAHRKAEPARTVDVAIAEGIAVRGDPFLLRIAVEHLLSNAWKFTRTSQNARIEIAPLASGEPGLFVRDNGIGFPEEFAGKLFGRFERLHDQSELEGTGIGLAIVHRIVARHGGRVWAEGARGKGATFAFALPAPSRDLPANVR